MAEYKFYLRQPAASELVDRLLSVVEEVSPNSKITSFSIGTNSGNIIFNPGNSPVGVKTFKNRKDPTGILSVLAERPFLDVNNLSLATDNDYNFSIKNDKGFCILLNTTGIKDNNFKEINPITDALNKHFHLLRQQEVQESMLPAAERDANQTARAILLEFTSQAARLASLSASNTERMNEVIIKKTGELDSRYEQKNKDLEETIRNKNKELEFKEEVFQKEKARFDARENTVVRRDLLGKIETILGVQKEIAITPKTIKKRTPIHLICIVALLLALCLIAAFGYKVFMDSSLDLHHIAPLSAGLLLFVTTSIFYIRWTDLWFKEHANAEFENRKFYTDIMRASWIAELLFEWKDKKEVPFPEQLITSYTTGLFKTTDHVKTTKHPFDDLKSLAGSISEIKFSNKGGVSLKKRSEQE